MKIGAGATGEEQADALLVGTKIDKGRLARLTAGGKILATHALSKLERTTAPENQIRQQNRMENRLRRVPHPTELGTASYRIHKQGKQVARPRLEMKSNSDLEQSEQHNKMQKPDFFIKI
jgi:hypothetical protein